ncbi:hypothetical protein HMPREF0240_00384 [Clostridium sp. D5]|nr:hypothetical protein HMPREF0240_00384 [Clostridium sp. D5]
MTKLCYKCGIFGVRVAPKGRLGNGGGGNVWSGPLPGQGEADMPFFVRGAFAENG